MVSTYDAIVVGAGISGTATAYYLKTAHGLSSVLLLEKGPTPAVGGTGKSAAIMRQHYSTRLMSRIARASLEIFRDLPQEIGCPPVLTQSGWFMLVPEALREACIANVEMQRSVGIETRLLSDDERARMLPFLDPTDIAAVVHEPQSGYCDPVRSAEAFAEAFVRAGGEARYRTPCRGLLRDGDRITGVLLDEGEASAGVVVNAAGPWARFLAESAGLDLPLRTVREQDTVWELRPGRPLPTAPISNAVDAIYMRPMGGSRLLIGQGFPKAYFDVDPYNYKETADPGFISLMLERVERRLPSSAGMKLVMAYGALYDVAPDWYPFVGPRDGLAGYADFNGGSGHGFKIAPGLARALCRWLIDGVVEDDFRQLSHDRVARDALFVGSYGGNRG